MKDQINTIREALEFIDGLKTGGLIQGFTRKALTALSELERMAEKQEFSLAFYKRRCDALQQWQSKMRDPERTTVCDILANGCTLEPAGNRYAAPPAQQPQYEAGDMASAHNDGFRAGVASVAQQPQAEVVQACGHPMSLLLRSAESNEPLYCEACDDKSGCHDAERRETELLDANRRLQEKIGSADALKLHAIEELCQLGYTVKDGELFPPDHLHKLMEAANHPLCGKQTEAVPPSNCRQRLAHEGKAYPRSSCAACGAFSPKWKECDAAIAAQGEKP